MTRQIDNLEAETRSEGVRIAFEKRVKDWRDYLKEKGRLDELEAIGREFEAAMEGGDVAVAEGKLKTLDALAHKVYVQTIDYWMGLLQYLHGRFQELNLLRLAGPRFEQGVRAANRGDLHELSTLCMELINLLPREERGRLDIESPRVVSHVQ